MLAVHPALGVYAVNKRSKHSEASSPSVYYELQSLENDVNERELSVAKISLKKFMKEIKKLDIKTREYLAIATAADRATSAITSLELITDARPETGSIYWEKLQSAVVRLREMCEQFVPSKLTKSLVGAKVYNDSIREYIKDVLYDIQTSVKNIPSGPVYNEDTLLSARNSVDKLNKWEAGYPSVFGVYGRESIKSLNMAVNLSIPGREKYFNVHYVNQLLGRILEAVISEDVKYAKLSKQAFKEKVVKIATLYYSLYDMREERIVDSFVYKGPQASCVVYVYDIASYPVAGNQAEPGYAIFSNGVYAGQMGPGKYDKKAAERILDQFYGEVGEK